ncbi:phosphotransferase family protein [Pseudochelatococcus sp. G4_1912]|uniref:phosphotransferase family protein n=1 Tax=Pseudochelatococcus sp. G4_1912 TaxID=3114288 RepID=UPI0039C6B0B6
MLSSGDLLFINKKLGPIFSNSAVVQKIDGGDVNEAYVVNSVRERYFIKKIALDESATRHSLDDNLIANSIRFSEIIARQMSFTGRTVSALMMGDDCLLNVGGSVLTVYPFADGRMRDGVEISSDMVQEIALFLTQLHRSPLNIEREFAEKKVAHYKEIGEVIIDSPAWKVVRALTHKSYVFPSLNIASDYIIKNKNKLSFAVNHLSGDGVCHNDLKPKNVLWGSDHKFWVIDWDAAGLFDVSADYLDTLLAWCTVYENGKLSLDSEKVKVFYKAYPPIGLDKIENSVSIVLVKWYFWLAMCLKNTFLFKGKWKRNLWNIHYASEFIASLIDGRFIERLLFLHQPSALAK